MAEPWKVERDKGRVFLTLGNYEFEVLVPKTNMGATVEFMAISTERLLTEKMEAVVNG